MTLTSVGETSPLTATTQQQPGGDKDASPSPHGQYGSFVAYCFSVNYILGVGVLSVPHAFYKGGIVLGPIMLFGISVLAVLSFIWIIETLSRAEIYKKYLEGQDEKKKQAKQDSDAAVAAAAAMDESPNDDVADGMDDDDDDDSNEQRRSSKRKSAINSKYDNDDTQETTDGDNIGGAVMAYQTASGEDDKDVVAKQQLDNQQEFMIAHRKFEMNEVANLFLGKPAKMIYEICIVLYLYGSLWGYVAVFAESAAAHIPLPLKISEGALSLFTCNVYEDSSLECTWLYIIYVGVFALMVVPLTCLNLTEQKPLQVFMAMFRFFGLGLMTLAIAFSMMFDPYSRYPQAPDQPIDMNPPHLSPYKSFDFIGLYKLLPVCIFSQILHHSVPGLSQPVKNKRHLVQIFSAVFISTFTFYSLLGVALGMYYGPNIHPTCSLNFGFFRGGASFLEPVPLWASAVTLIVVLFPAVDVLSSFPLNGVTLGNNMFAAFFSGTRWHSNRTIEVAFRLVAAIPPVIGAMFVKDLGVILQYVGLVGLVITFIYPPMLQLMSKRVCERTFGHSKTPYTFPVISSPVVCIGVALFAALAIVYCIITNILVETGVLG